MNASENKKNTFTSKLSNKNQIFKDDIIYD